jgi:hypothetical protein
LLVLVGSVEDDPPVYVTKSDLAGDANPGVAEKQRATQKQYEEGGYDKDC